jgi:ankyrin repeat protein
MFGILKFFTDIFSTDNNVEHHSTFNYPLTSREEGYLQHDYHNETNVRIEGVRFDALQVKLLVDKLTTNTVLKSLSLQNCGFNHTNVQPLANYLTSYPHINQLNLAQNRLDGINLRLLLQSLRHHPLRELSLANNGFSLNDILILCEELAYFSSLQALDLSENQLTNADLAEICKWLNHARSLHLNLANNAFDNDGLAQLAKCLEKQQTLTSLNLSGNAAITGTGLPILAGSLCKNKFLRRLYLPYETMDKVSALGFIELLAPKKKRQLRNTSLIELDLKGWEQIPNKARFTQSKARFPLRFNETAWWARFQQDHIIDSAKEKYLVDFVVASKNKFIQQNIQQANKLFGAQNSKELAELLKSASLYTCRDFSLTDDGASLLHLAVINKQEEIISYLLAQGFNTEIVNKAGKTALQLAQQKHDPQLIALLSKPAQKSVNSRQLHSKRRRSNNSRMADTDPTASNSLFFASPPAKKPKLAQPTAPIIIEDEISYSPQQLAEPRSTEVSPQVLFKQLLLLIADDQTLQLEMRLSAQSVRWSDEQGNTLLHHAVILGRLQCIELILNRAVNPLQLINQLNEAGEAPIHALIRALATPRFSLVHYLDMAWLLIKKGADPNLAVPDLHLGRTQLTALHLAVIYEHYALMKIILGSVQCDINRVDSGNLTALDWAIEKRNPVMLSRLLIHRNLAAESLRATLNYYKQQPTDSMLVEILSLLEKRLVSSYPLNTAGIQWVKQFRITYGSHYAKPKRSLTIDSEKQHSYLQTQNLFSRHRTYNFKQEVKDIDGNPVTASLIFFVSTAAYQAGANLSRHKIRINLNFLPSYHLTSHEQEVSAVENIARIKHRVDSVAYEVLNKKRESNGLLKDAEDIQALYNDETGDINPLFPQLFHHGEQALLNYLEQPDTIAKIVGKLMQHDKFTSGCKVYGLILELHSPRYLCGNCEMAILGEQNAEQSQFLRQLAELLSKRGCALPRYNYLRMLTQASSYIAYPNETHLVEKSEHADLVIDFRSCLNNIIMARDATAFEESELTQYHSNIQAL